MPRLLPRVALVAGLALAALPGCRKEEASTPPPPASPVAPPQAAPPRAGVKVPLPPGWTAQVAPDGSFQAGPPGRPLLRVDLRPGEGPKLPSADELSEQVLQRFKDFAVSLDQEEEAEGLALVRVTMAPQLPDGGVGPEAPALFGARRVGADLFLCATLPGASAEEVRLATEACRQIQVQPAPAPSGR